MRAASAVPMRASARRLCSCCTGLGTGGRGRGGRGGRKRRPVPKWLRRRAVAARDRTSDCLCRQVCPRLSGRRSFGRQPAQQTCRPLQTAWPQPKGISRGKVGERDGHHQLRLDVLGLWREEIELLWQDHERLSLPSPVPVSTGALGTRWYESTAAMCVHIAVPTLQAKDQRRRHGCKSQGQRARRRSHRARLVRVRARAGVLRGRGSVLKVTDADDVFLDDRFLRPHARHVLRRRRCHPHNHR